MPSKVKITRLKDADAEAKRLTELFSKAEKEINDKLLRLLAKGKADGYTSKQLKKQEAEVKAILSELNKTSSASVDKLAQAAYYAGVREAEQQLKTAGIEILATMSGINARVMQAYASQLQDRRADVITAAGRSTVDLFRAIDIDRALAGTLAGYESIDETTRKIIERAEKGEGIVGFVDSAKRTWSMSAYVDMLTRTATMKLYNEAKKNEFVAHREDLVIVSSHGGGCDLCKPFDGKVLSLTGATEGYTTLDEAEAEGLFHPNCRHTYDLYIDENNPELGIIEEGEGNEPAEENGRQAGSPFDELGIKGTEKWGYYSNPSDIETCLIETNPNFKSGEEGYRINCQRCVPAYEMRRRGYDVTALPCPSKNDKLYAGGWMNIFDNFRFDFCTGTGEQQKADIEKAVKKWGNGARAEIHVNWKGTKGDAGHVFIAENINGVVKFIDPQSGSSDCTSYFADIKTGFGDTCYGRIDNLKPTDDILKCCKQKEL